MRVNAYVAPILETYVYIYIYASKVFFMKRELWHSG